MPLYVTNGKLQLGEPGQLAAQRACCCDEEGDNPEDCFCPDCCIYQIEVVSPIATGRRPTLPCVLPTENPVITQLGYEVMDCGEEIGGFATGQLSAEWDAGCGLSSFVTLRNWRRVSSSTYTGSDGSFFPIGVPANVAVFTESRIGVAVYCDSSFASGPKYFVSMSFQVAASAETQQDSRQRSGVLFIRNVDRQELQSPDCVKKANAACDANSSLNRAAYLQTPIEFSISWDDPDGREWDYDDVWAQFGDQTDINNCVQAIKDNFSATFRITQRQSCRIVNCDCSTSLDGLKATFEGKEFTLGTEEPYNEFFSGYELVTTHYKDFSGNYVFEKYKVLESPAGTIGDVQFATVYCETDEESDPPVPRWYVRFESICRQFAPDAETKRTEIGYLPCSESAGCAGRAEGDPVPLGSPIDIEEIEGSPETTDGLNACTPPARADLTIFEDCG